MKAYLFIISLFASISYAHTATCTSITSGNWSNPLTWSCGAVPSPGDTIIIDAAHIVVLSSNTDLTGAPCEIVINGILMFDTPSAKLFLECGSTVIINPGGSIQSSGRGTASHSIKICGSEVWKGPDGPLFGPLILGFNPLPIELIALNASQNLRTVNVIWTTASEYNNDYFSIYGSNDGNTWELMGTVRGAGNSSEKIDYSFAFDNYSDFTFVRLDQTDYDGQPTSFESVRIAQSKLDQISIFPNPSNGDRLNIQLEELGSYEVNILNQNGQVLFSNTYFDCNNIILNNLQLQSGHYFLRIGLKDQTTTHKISVR